MTPAIRPRSLEFVDLVQGEPELAIVRMGLHPEPPPGWRQAFEAVAAQILWPGGYAPTLGLRAVDLVVAEAQLERGVRLVERLIARVNDRWVQHAEAHTVPIARTASAEQRV